MVSTQIPPQSLSSLAPKTTEARTPAARTDAKTLAEHTENTVVATAKKTGFTPLTAEQAANNILGFIARQLDRDKAAGASEEELESRLQAGLKGFKQGFNDAKEKLEALSLLNPPVYKAIGKTYDLVMEGIDNLALQHLGKLLPPAEVQVSKPDAASGERRVSLNAQYLALRADTFQFELTTREGDKVSISASRQAGSSAGMVAENGNLSLQGAFYSSSNFSLSVAGDLNDDELSAIGQLLEQVDALAADFYRGDVSAAFNAALSLGYDSEQISAFSLNLTRVDVQRASTAYTQGNSDMGSLQQQLAPLGHFVKDLLTAVETAQQFGEPRSLLGNLAEAMVEPETGQRTSFAEFVKALLDEADSLAGLPTPKDPV